MNPTICVFHLLKGVTLGVSPETCRRVNRWVPLPRDKGDSRLFFRLLPQSSASGEKACSGETHRVKDDVHCNRTPPWLLPYVAVIHSVSKTRPLEYILKAQLNIQKRVFLQSTAGKIACPLKDLGAGENLLGVCVFACSCVCN